MPPSLTSGFRSQLSEDGLLSGATRCAALPYGSAGNLASTSGQMTLRFLSQQLPGPWCLVMSQSCARQGAILLGALWKSGLALQPASPRTSHLPLKRDKALKQNSISFSLPQMCVPGHLRPAPCAQDWASP